MSLIYKLRGICYRSVVALSELGRLTFSVMFHLLSNNLILDGSPSETNEKIVNVQYDYIATV